MADPKDEDLLGMSDEDIMNMSAAPVGSPEGDPEPEANPEDEPTEDLTDDAEGDDDPAGGEDDPTPQENADDDPDNAGSDDADGDDVLGSDDDDVEPVFLKEPKDDDPAPSDDKAKSQKPAEKDGKDAGTKKPEAKDKPKADDGSDADRLTEKAAGYDKIMAPFKANGKEIKLTSPEEAVKLMQMGANYTKKLQQLQPHLRVAKMLENNGLADEAKVSYLIDLYNKNPDAIRKLVSDAGIDPIDIDTSKDTNYRPQNHSVSDAQMAFDTALTEVSADPAGGQVVVQIDKDWDDASKQVLYKDPNILHVMTEHKASGAYDQITSEIERQKLLGNFAGVPYINAYYQVGQALQQQGLLRTSEPQAQNPQVPTPPPGQQEQPAPRQEQPNPAPLDRRPAPRPSADPNSNRAKAASPVKTKPAKAKSQEVNHLAMSDEDFENASAFEGRI